MIPNPHDLLFKGVFGQPEHARGMLRSIVPAMLAETLDWSTLTPHGLEALAQVVRYILEVNEHVEPEELRGLLERALGPEAKETIMTAGQRLIEQGRQQGIQGVLLRLLRQRFGDAVDAQVEQRIATASLDQVEVWTGRVLSAATLAAVIAD
jgi:hypothetical protein